MFVNIVREAIEGRGGFGEFVVGENDGVSFALRNRNTYHFVGKTTRLPGCGCTLVRIDRKSILICSGDCVFLGTQLSAIAHRYFAINIEQTIFSDAIEQTNIAKLGAVAAIEVMWRLGHVFHATNNYNMVIASENALSAEHY